MLDQQHRGAIKPNTLYQRAQRHGFGGVHAGGRFVERQQLGVGGQGAGDLQAALVTVGKTGGLIVGARLDADIRQQFMRPRFDGRFLGPRGGTPQHRTEHAGTGAYMAAYHHVLDHRQAGKQADVLEGAGNAALRDLVRLETGKRRAVEFETAAVERINTRQQVEQGGLAGAIGADEAVDFTARNGKIHLGQRLHAAKAFPEVGAGEQRAHAAPLRTANSRLRTAEGHRPAGRKIITSTSARPNNSMRMTSGSISIFPNSAICAGATV